LQNLLQPLRCYVFSCSDHLQERFGPFGLFSLHFPGKSLSPLIGSLYIATARNRLIRAPLKSLSVDFCGSVPDR
jgi:hypothetical protein